MRLVVDWDGTVTEVDGLDLVLREFGDVRIYDAAENRLGRDLTLHEVIALEFESVRSPLEDVVAWVRAHARVRSGFSELARRRRPLVVSSGFRELIEPVLEREGVLDTVELQANSVDALPEGWWVHFRVSEVCDTCGEPCKRGDLPLGRVVYAGDGHSDYCAALAADRVFAIGGLARWLARRGVPFTPLTDFRALASEL